MAEFINKTQLNTVLSKVKEYVDSKASTGGGRLK